MWSAEPIGAVSTARAPSANGQHLVHSRDPDQAPNHDRGQDRDRSPPEPRHRPNATPAAPSRYAVHNTAVTTAEDKEIGTSPGAQPRGPRPGFAAEGPAAATSRRRANERLKNIGRSHASLRRRRAARASHTSRYCRARWIWPCQVEPVTRC